jgi:2'-5' RNA ligase
VTEGPSHTVRLFVALEIPGDVRDALEGWRAPVLRDTPGLRGVGAAALHATLCFIGSRPAGDVEAIAGACAVAADSDRVALRVGAALWLPRRRPHVLAVTLEDVGGRLAPLQASLAEALAATGCFEPEARPFLPHITVARVRRAARVKPVDLDPPPSLTFDAAAVVLYRSHLGGQGGRAGVRYEALATIALPVADGGHGCPGGG